MKRFIWILFTVCLLLSGCGNAEETDTLEDTMAVSAVPAEEEKDPLVYVSLGDSIARGYGLSDLTEERFSTIAAQYWKDENTEVYNYGVDGQTSSELLAMLQDGYADKLAEADVVSVSIGANNILQHAWQFLYDYYVYLYSEPPQFTDEEIAVRFREVTAGADEGCVILEQDMPVLLETIRKINPDCQILFLTLYNPYEAVNTEMHISGLPVQLAALSDTYVTKINACIREWTALDDNTAIVDVYAAFAGRGRELLYAYSPEGQDSADMDMNHMDPHPNAKGHKVIGALVGQAYSDP